VGEYLAKIKGQCWPCDKHGSRVQMLLCAPQLLQAQDRRAGHVPGPGGTYGAFRPVDLGWAAEVCGRGAESQYALRSGPRPDNGFRGLGWSAVPSFGAELVDAKGNITVKSDAVKQALEYMVKLTKFLPDDVYSYDDASITAR